MSSHASVNAMLAFEGAVDVEFPDHMPCEPQSASREVTVS
jgi:hypothetical protein